MILAPLSLATKARKSAAVPWCLEYFVIENPSPGYSTTPLIGWSENGGAKAATSLFIASVNFWVSQVPSTIIAAFPLVKSSRLFVLVSTSEFVQPLASRSDHFENCATLVGSFHGILPLYRPFHSSTEYAPIIM